VRRVAPPTKATPPRPKVVGRKKKKRGKEKKLRDLIAVVSGRERKKSAETSTITALNLRHSSPHKEPIAYTNCHNGSQEGDCRRRRQKSCDNQSRAGTVPSLKPQEKKRLKKHSLTPKTITSDPQSLESSPRTHQKGGQPKGSRRRETQPPRRHHLRRRPGLGRRQRDAHLADSHHQAPHCRQDPPPTWQDPVAALSVGCGWQSGEQRG
jgi:hypothetical protein